MKYMPHPRSVQIAGEKPLTGRKKRTAEPGRVCSYPGCGTKLSIYNKSKERRCAQHPLMKAPAHWLSKERQTK